MRNSIHSGAAWAKEVEFSIVPSSLGKNETIDPAADGERLQDAARVSRGDERIIMELENLPRSLRDY